MCVKYDVSQCLVFFSYVILSYVSVEGRLFHQAYVGFRRFCIESENLPADLHIVLSDILQDAGLYVQKCPT